MKRIKLLIIIMFTFSTIVLNAQTDKGKILVGASSNIGLAGSGSDLVTLGFSNSKTKSDGSVSVQSDPQRSTSINFVPRIGYFVRDNFVIGLDINLGFRSNSRLDDSGFKSTQTLFSVGPFARYYIPAGTILPFLEVGASFGSVNS